MSTDDQTSQASTKASWTRTKGLVSMDDLELLCWRDMKMQVKQCVDLGTKKLKGTPAIQWASDIDDKMGKDMDITAQVNPFFWVDSLREKKSVLAAGIMTNAMPVDAKTLKKEGMSMADLKNGQAASLSMGEGRMDAELLHVPAGQILVRVNTTSEGGVSNEDVVFCSDSFYNHFGKLFGDLGGKFDNMTPAKMEEAMEDKGDKLNPKWTHVFAPVMKQLFDNAEIDQKTEIPVYVKTFVVPSKHDLGLWGVPIGHNVLSLLQTSSGAWSCKHTTPDDSFFDMVTGVYAKGEDDDGDGIKVCAVKIEATDSKFDLETVEKMSTGKAANKIDKTNTDEIDTKKPLASFAKLPFLDMKGKQTDQQNCFVFEMSLPFRKMPPKERSCSTRSIGSAKKHRGGQAKGQTRSVEPDEEDEEEEPELTFPNISNGIILGPFKGMPNINLKERYLATPAASLMIVKAVTGLSKKMTETQMETTGIKLVTVFAEESRQMAKMFKEIHASPMMNIHDSASSLVNPNTKQKLALEESEVGLVKASKFNFNVASPKPSPSPIAFGGAGFKSDGVACVPLPSPEAQFDDDDDDEMDDHTIHGSGVVEKIFKQAVVIDKIIELLGYDEIMENRGVDKQYALNILYARLLKNKKDGKKSQEGWEEVSLLEVEVAKVLDMEGKQAKQKKQATGIDPLWGR